MTSIGDNAFSGCSGLTGNLIIPNSVTSIGNYAFFGCSGLTSLTVLAETPPTIYSSTFSNCPKSIPVYVPCGRAEAYQSAAYWNEFTNIQEVCSQQTISLSEGWTWFSPYIEDDDLLEQLETGLGTNGMSINTQGAILVYRNGMWMGGMNSIENAKGYKIKTNAPIEVTIEGQAIDPSTCPITITEGSNWIGYPLSESKTVGNALAGFTPSNGDVIMTQGGTTVYRAGQWMPTTFTFEPGKGYVYKSTSSETKTLIFSNSK